MQNNQDIIDLTVRFRSLNSNNNQTYIKYYQISIHASFEELYTFLVAQATTLQFDSSNDIRITASKAMNLPFIKDTYQTCVNYFKAEKYSRQLLVEEISTIQKLIQQNKEHKQLKKPSIKQFQGKYITSFKQAEIEVTDIFNQDLEPRLNPTLQHQFNRKQYFPKKINSRMLATQSIIVNQDIISTDFQIISLLQHIDLVQRQSSQPVNHQIHEESIELLYDE